MSTSEEVRAIASAHADKPGALMPTLVDINRRFGHVPAEAAAIVADVLNISIADVAGAASFYSDFRDRAPGAVVVKVCRAEACQAAGGDALAASAESLLGCRFGETNGDATLEAVYCFGNCALSPAASVNDRLMGRATASAIADAVAGAKPA